MKHGTSGILLRNFWPEKKDHGDYLQSSVHEKIKYLNEIA